jgi:predicted O-methyltransferase YrrM
MGWYSEFRSIYWQLRSLFDPSDPLTSFNRHLARRFITHFPGAVATKHNVIPTEGHILKSQARYFQGLVLHHLSVKSVAEIGFNAGHSSWVFLSSRPDITVTSFDLGEHEYVHMTKSLIDSRFPGRHELITGDSQITVPAYAAMNPERRFDLIFIDGGHDIDVAKADVANLRLLATSSTIVIMDDLNPLRGSSKGPIIAWTDAQREGFIHEDLRLHDGFPIVDALPNEIKEASEVWALGHYLDLP